MPRWRCATYSAPPGEAASRARGQHRAGRTGAHLTSRPPASADQSRPSTAAQRVRGPCRAPPGGHTACRQPSCSWALSAGATRMGALQPRRVHQPAGCSGARPRALSSGVLGGQWPCQRQRSGEAVHQVVGGPQAVRLALPSTAVALPAGRPTVVPVPARWPQQLGVFLASARETAVEGNAAERRT